MTADSLQTNARAALRLAVIDPKLALERAAEIESAASQTEQWSAASIAFHAIGIAAKQLDDLAKSHSALRMAVRTAGKAHSAALVAEARASLAATLCLQGRTGRALTEVAAALVGLDGAAAAKVQTQQAAIMLVTGRREEALAALRKALPVLRRSGEYDWATRALSNRSLLHIQNGAFHLAEADLLMAQRLAADHGLASWVAYVEHNLGWLKSSQGDVVAALGHFERAQDGYQELGTEHGELFEARARLLLSVRLVDEARTAAEAAVRVHREQKRELQVVEALLLLSTVANVQGDGRAAEDAATGAMQGFRRVRHASGMALARWARLQARMVQDPNSVNSHQARRSANELAAAGWAVPSLEARVLAGRLALAQGRSAQARGDLAHAARARFTGPADARSRAWLAEALLRRAEGRRASAKRAISAGLQVLQNYQTTLGATELRASVSAHSDGLARVGLSLAMEDADARQVLSFVERGRASALLRPPSPPEDPELSAALTELRTTMSEIASRRTQGRSTSELVHRQVRLEDRIADRCRRSPATAGPQWTTARRFGELIDALGNGPALVEFVELDDILYAVLLADGTARLRRLGPASALEQNLMHLSFALRQIAGPVRTPAGRSAARMVVDRLRTSFDRLLFGPLAGHLADRPLIVVPSTSLQSFPWSVLPTCEGRPVTVAPSARLWMRAAERVGPTSDGGMVAVAGPGLPGARDEAIAVAGLYRGAACLVDERAAAPAVLAAMDGADLVHIAAHGRLRSDNPFFSSLLMADGPLTMYELQRLERAPFHVVLAACEAAGAVTVGSDEVLGLAAVLLAQGTSSLVAPVIQIPDQATVHFMTAYHGELLAGWSPAEALCRAQPKAGAESDSSWAASAAFVCLGAGHRLNQYR